MRRVMARPVRQRPNTPSRILFTVVDVIQGSLSGSVPPTGVHHVEKRGCLSVASLVVTYRNMDDF